MNKVSLFSFNLYSLKIPVLHLKAVCTMTLERKCSYMPLRDIMSAFLPTGRLVLGSLIQ